MRRIAPARLPDEDDAPASVPFEEVGEVVGQAVYVTGDPANPVVVPALIGIGHDQHDIAAGHPFRFDAWVLVLHPGATGTH